MAYEAAVPDAPRAKARHIRKFPLSVSPRPLSLSKSLYDLALDVAAPYRRADYPGRERAWVQIAAQMPWVLRDVRQGKRGYDIATLERLGAFIDSRINSAMETREAIRAECDRLKALPDRRTGFCRVDPITGHDKRYRGRKNSPHNK